jgi:hypothetical protein
MSDHKLKTVEGERKSTLSPAEMKSMLQADRQTRESRVAQQIQTILAKERCVLNPKISLTVRGIIPEIEITAQD